ncbi:hypothetical protein ACFU5O_13580 [Streptomyces sp. NPDC057445]
MSTRRALVVAREHGPSDDTDWDVIELGRDDADDTDDQARHAAARPPPQT